MHYLMSNQQVLNLAAPLNPGDTTMQVVAGTGAAWPAIVAPDALQIKLIDAKTGAISEIVTATLHNAGSDFFTISRAQEGTTQKSFIPGDHAALFITNAVYNNLMQIDPAPAWLSWQNPIAQEWVTMPVCGSAYLELLVQPDYYTRTLRLRGIYRPIGNNHFTDGTGMFEFTAKRFPGTATFNSPFCPVTTDQNSASGVATYFNNIVSNTPNLVSLYGLAAAQASWAMFNLDVAYY